MTPSRSLIICTTPRSGSTLVCAILRVAGVAGWPESWYRAEDRAEYEQDWGVPVNEPTAFLQGAIRAGSSGNGVFGIRVQAVTRVPMLRELAQVFGPAEDVTVLHRAFGPSTFIHIHRLDTVAQAVSRMKAEASQIWHLDGSQFKAAADRARYDAVALDAFRKEAVEGNEAWDQWFASQGIEPVRLIYEGFADDPVAMVRSLLDDLGLQVPPDTSLEVPNRRMADLASAEWATRYRAERGIADAL